MKLSDLRLVDDVDERSQLLEAIRGFNQTARDYPSRSTVHQEFSRQAAATPDAVAVDLGDHRVTYQELEGRSNRIARLLLEQGLGPEELVGVLLQRDTSHVAAALLGVLKAGGAYLPLDAEAPRARMAQMLDDGRVRMLIGERGDSRLLNQLQWDCRLLDAILCVDSDDFHGEPETGGAFMRRELWDHVGDESFDDISGGGWKSSFTGEWLSRQVMDEYGDNAEAKLTPLVTAESRVLEIGCSSGITLFRIAPKVARYFGTDLSANILEKTQQEADQRGLSQVRLAHLAADETDRVDGSHFDLVVLNSVAQCFRGHNYFRDVIRKAVDKMAESGYLFVGDISDQDLKPRMLAALRAFREANAGKGYRTQADRSEELYLSRAFLEDLTAEIPELESVTFSRSLGKTPCEMTDYGFDALFRVNKQAPAAPRQRHKRQLDRRALAAVADAPVEVPVHSGALAYVMYTSGTTGLPKGVMVEHRAILRLVKNPDYADLDQQTVTVRQGALGFDASTFELWAPLLNGGRVCHAPAKAFLDPQQAKQTLRAFGVNTLWLTAGLFNQLADADLEIFSGLRWMLTGGERLSPAHVAKVRNRFPDLNIVNGYGPTENTTFTACHRITEVGPGDIPIGRPVSNSQAYVLDAQDLAPVGAPGELAAAGAGLGRGYWADPRLTALRFRPHPFADGERLYLTGDLARWRPDGTLEFLGRADGQVKVRGFRIELGEIEARIAAHEDVAAAVCTVIDHGAESKEIAAYYVPRPDRDVALEDLRDRLAADLPDYMIPASYTRLEQIPLTPNGKVDRRALPRPERTRAADWTAPETDTERRLARIWESLLDVKPIGATDDFFALGGHSLKVVKLASLVREELGVDLPLTTVFQTPTIRALAAELVRRAQFGIEGVDQPMVRMSRGAHAVFAFPPGRSDALGYTGLAAQLDDIALHGFNFLEGDRPAARYADLIESAAHAPYTLFGHSGGGRLAYHVAAELERRGHPVAAVIMADSLRYLAPIPITPADVDATVQQFVQSDAVRPYLGTGLLRDKAVQRIRAYYEYLYSTVDRAVINADIHLVLCEGAVTEFHSPDGDLLAGAAQWAEVTSGRFATHQGFGGHSEMFDAPFAAQNAALLLRLFSARRTAATGADA